MKLKMMLLITLAGFSVAAHAIEPIGQTPLIAGSWNVTSTNNGDGFCGISKVGDVTAHIWIVNQSADGKVSVSVQGETSFPQLTGKFNKATNTLIVSGFSPARSRHTPTASWFKLKIDKKGDLVGVRRYLGLISNTQYPCFEDTDVLAKKQ